MVFTETSMSKIFDNKPLPKILEVWTPQQSSLIGYLQKYPSNNIKANVFMYECTDVCSFLTQKSLNKFR